jgi:hypothetical protein
MALETIFGQEECLLAFGHLRYRSAAFGTAVAISTALE